MSLGQLKVMSAIEQCRSAALGGHVLRCEACEQVQIAYNSCRNRHCPKCQASAARRWLEARQADLLPVEYYHVVFTLPAPIAAIAYSNKAVIYDLLFAVAAETLRTIDVDSVQSNGYAFQVEMNYRTVQHGMRIAEVPITFADRSRGESKMSLAVQLESALIPWKLLFGRRP